jgi:hypothetical protein
LFLLLSLVWSSGLFLQAFVFLALHWSAGIYSPDQFKQRSDFHALHDIIDSDSSSAGFNVFARAFSDELLALCHGPWIRWLALSHLKVVLSWLKLYCIFPFVDGPDRLRSCDLRSYGYNRGLGSVIDKFMNDSLQSGNEIQSIPPVVARVA